MNAKRANKNSTTLTMKLKKINCCSFVSVDVRPWKKKQEANERTNERTNKNRAECCLPLIYAHSRITKDFSISVVRFHSHTYKETQQENKKKNDACFVEHGQQFGKK